MKFLQRQIIQDPEVAQAITAEALKHDLDRTKLLGENDWTLDCNVKNIINLT